MQAKEKFEFFIALAISKQVSKPSDLAFPTHLQEKHK